MHNIAMILGRTLWTHEGTKWKREAIEINPRANAETMARLSELFSSGRTAKSVLLFEPEGMIHENVETPKVDRAVFASLARTRRDHPVVTSSNLGWGIELPEMGAGGTYATLLHSEMVPGLVYIRDACVEIKCLLPFVWTAYTAMELLLKSRSANPKPCHSIILTHEFVAVATWGIGRRFFRAWTGPMLERDWQAFAASIAEPVAKGSVSAVEREGKRTGVVIISDGESHRNSPLWTELQASGRLEAVLDLAALANSAVRIPGNHPGNLIEAFPRPRNLNRFLLMGAFAGCAAIVVLALAASKDRGVYEKHETELELQISKLTTRLEGRKRNEYEMRRLGSLASYGAKFFTVSKQEELLALALALPDTLTLASLDIAQNGHFEIEALVVGPGFDTDSARVAFAKCGFVPEPTNGWLYDAINGRLQIRGAYSEIHP